MAMQNNFEKIFIGIDNEVVELTGDEKEAFLIDKQILVERQKQIKSELKAEAEAKATAKAALLDKLGITAEEAQLLLS